MKTNNKKVKRIKGFPVYSTQHPDGNRKSRRKAVAIERLKPNWDRLNKINKNITDTKEEGRKFKAKHLEEVRSRTEARKLSIKK